MRGFIVDRLSEIIEVAPATRNYFESRLYMIKTRGTASTYPIWWFFFMFFWLHIVQITCRFRFRFTKSIQRSRSFESFARKKHTAKQIVWVLRTKKAYSEADRLSAPHEKRKKKQKRKMCWWYYAYPLYPLIRSIVLYHPEHRPDETGRAASA